MEKSWERKNTLLQSQCLSNSALKMTVIVKIALFIPLFLFFSCAGDCRLQEVEKAEWITRYEDYYLWIDTIKQEIVFLDTLVAYSTVGHKQSVEYKRNSKGERVGQELTHHITIKNESNDYSNFFAVRLIGKKYNETATDWQDLVTTTNYVTINPQQQHTFAIKHSSWWLNEDSGYHEGNISINIMQRPSSESVIVRSPVRIRKKHTRRIDELHLSKIEVNTCEESIEALEKKYQTIKDLYNEKIEPSKQKIIINDEKN